MSVSLRKLEVAVLKLSLSLSLEDTSSIDDDAMLLFRLVITGELSCDDPKPILGPDFELVRLVALELPMEEGGTYMVNGLSSLLS